MNKATQVSQESEAQILARFGFTLEQIDADVDTLEDERKPDSLTTVYHNGSPLDEVRNHPKKTQQ